MSFLLEMRKRIYKDMSHPDIVTSLFSLAQQLSLLGQYQKSLEAFENVLGKTKI